MGSTIVCDGRHTGLGGMISSFRERLIDRVVRRKMALHETPLDRFQVRLARTTQEYASAFQLVHFAYVYQGIEGIHAPDLHLNPQHLLPEAYVLVAYEGHQLVGTVTVTLDSPAGLPLDKDYPEALEALRQDGARIAESGAFAIVERCWKAGVSNLLYMAANALTTQILRASHVVIGVHPKATPFYRAAFNFDLLGAPKPHASLHAPVVGLVQDLSRLRPFLSRRFRQPMTSGKLPVEHFFGEPLPCIELPYGQNEAELVRWKMPRAVLQWLLAQRADMVAGLDEPTRAHLAHSRSRATLDFAHHDIDLAGMTTDLLNSQAVRSC